MKETVTPQILHKPLECTRPFIPKVSTEAPKTQDRIKDVETWPYDQERYDLVPAWTYQQCF